MGRRWWGWLRRWGRRRSRRSGCRVGLAWWIWAFLFPLPFLSRRVFRLLRGRRLESMLATGRLGLVEGHRAVVRWCLLTAPGAVPLLMARLVVVVGPVGRASPRVDHGCIPSMYVDRSRCRPLTHHTLGFQSFVASARSEPRHPPLLRRLQLRPVSSAAS